jgi:hypothetical protein
MKKALLVFIIAMLNLATSFSQTYPVVAGVEFGSTYENCKRVLDKRFNNGKESFQSTPNQIQYFNIEFGGEHFDYCTFYFQNDVNRTFLYYIEFVSSFALDEIQYAKNKRDRIYNAYLEKYPFRWRIKDEDGFLSYVLGHDPLKEDDGFVVIEASKGKTKAGDMKYWTKVLYGPVDFVKPTDEI